MFYSERLGSISAGQLQAALDRFVLGTLLATSTISTGLFGQNLYVTSTRGEFVFRGAPHYAWQLPAERHFANLLHETSAAPVPWPYLVEPASDLFPWPWGYAILPKMPGESLADAKVYDALSSAQRLRLATAMGDMLSRLQAPISTVCGSYDVASDAIRAFDGGYIGRVSDRIRENGRRAKAYGALVASEEEWLDGLLDAAASLPEPSRYTVVHEDFNRNNLTARFGVAGVEITGVFDLMTCHYGDGLADLARQFCMFRDEAGGEALARAFVQTYLSRRAPLTPADLRRALLYLVDERLLVWEYCHRPGHDCRGWGVTGNLRSWLGRYLQVLEATLADSWA